MNIYFLRPISKARDDYTRPFREFDPTGDDFFDFFGVF